MFSPNSGLEWVEIDTSGGKHFLLKDSYLVNVLGGALGEDKHIDKRIADVQLRTLQRLAPIFPLLSTPLSCEKFGDWPDEPRYTCAGIILPQNKVATLVCSEGAKLVYGITHKDFTYIICKIKSDSYLKLPHIVNLQRAIATAPRCTRIRWVRPGAWLLVWVVGMGSGQFVNIRFSERIPQIAGQGTDMKPTLEIYKGMGKAVLKQKRNKICMKIR